MQYQMHASSPAIFFHVAHASLLQVTKLYIWFDLKNLSTPLLPNKGQININVKEDLLYVRKLPKIFNFLPRRRRTKHAYKTYDYKPWNDTQGMKVRCAKLLNNFFPFKLTTLRCRSNIFLKLIYIYWEDQAQGALDAEFASYLSRLLIIHQPNIHISCWILHTRMIVARPWESL